MTANHLLDAMGLLDDDLIQEAEWYDAPRRQKHYGTWLAWAASFAVVLVLGYGLTHLGMGGGAANGGGNNQTAASAPSAPSGGGSMNGGSTEVGDSDTAGGDGLPASQEPASSAPSEGAEGYPAVVIGDVVYRNTGETIPLFPDGEDLRYDISWYDEVSGEAVSGQGLCYLMLEDGSVAVSWDFQSQGWMIFAPDMPPEP